MTNVRTNTVRRCLHFGGRVVPGQRGQFVDHSIAPDPSDGRLHRGYASAIIGSAPIAFKVGA